MEFPVEGNYTPNFNKSECSIRIPGIACNEESPRSFRQTPRITLPRDGHVQAFRHSVPREQATHPNQQRNCPP